eukprot:1162092-Pelagomonas_calceolata.AAC.6
MLSVAEAMIAKFCRIKLLLDKGRLHGTEPAMFCPSMSKDERSQWAWIRTQSVIHPLEKR